ncbi:MAG: hypothetical protein FWE20_09560 [Defluviitaleaceae bacterium]|nr:hypothetical protein [Defluviitaleaceae bacterium]
MRKNPLQLMLAAAVCALPLTLTACVDDGVPAPIPPVENVIDIDWLDMLPESDGIFELTAAERAFYDEFIRTGDTSVLYGADPVSIIKLSVQAAIDGNFEHEFYLFHPDTIGDMTLEDHLPPPDAPPEFAGTPEFRQRMADLFFWRIDEGELELDGGRARISFYTDSGEPMTLGARLNEDGVWLVEHWS